ncbi:uncharacterized protein LOC129138156 [Pan troglodytes]|uniref:uncharacterized protein LOC129138156 n=1 Tax=Pan troglodytes TaxID=9598 RepID=UPI0030136A72
MRPAVLLQRPPERESLKVAAGVGRSERGAGDRQGGGRERVFCERLARTRCRVRHRQLLAEQISSLQRKGLHGGPRLRVLKAIRLKCALLRTHGPWSVVLPLDGAAVGGPGCSWLSIPGLARAPAADSRLDGFCPREGRCILLLGASLPAPLARDVLNLGKTSALCTRVGLLGTFEQLLWRNSRIYGSLYPPPCLQPRESQPKPARPCGPEQQSHSRQRELTRVARRSGAQAAEAAAAQLFPGDSGDSCRWGTPPATHLEPAAAPGSLALMDRLISQLDGPEPGMAVPAGRGKTKKVVHPLGGRGCLSLS